MMPCQFKAARPWICSGLLLLCPLTSLMAGEVKFQAMAELRLALTDDDTGWTDAGLGKARYGGEANDRQTVAEISDLSLLILPEWNETLSGVAHLHYQPEQANPLDVISALVRYRQQTESDWRFSSRLGLFFPPISLEHKGPAWQSPYSLTPSAINSWVGEELRTLGGELSLHYTGTTQSATLTHALFIANDPTGTILAWRGWALHDIKTGFYDDLPLPPIPAITPGGTFFPKQATQVEPFHEVDQHPGFYSAATWQSAALKMRYLHYDNWADQERLNHGRGQYAWHTRFNSASVQWQMTSQWEWLSQYLEGTSAMGRSTDGQGLVDIRFRSVYLLLSRAWGQHRLSARYDWFQVDDRDHTTDDNNQEQGNSWMAAYTFALKEQQHLLLEYLWIDSTRAARETLGLAPDSQESLIQLGYRLAF